MNRAKGLLNTVEAKLARLRVALRTRNYNGEPEKQKLLNTGKVFECSICIYNMCFKLTAHVYCTLANRKVFQYLTIFVLISVYYHC